MLMKWQQPLRQIYDRKPTKFDVENHLCEMRNMEPIVSINVLSNKRTELRQCVESFLFAEYLTNFPSCGKILYI